VGSRLERVNRSARPTLGAARGRGCMGGGMGRGGDEEGGKRSGEGEALT